MNQRRHIVITGTGRAGTTFLVELLTHLGLETGFSIESIQQMKDVHGRAGLEHDIRNGNCPFIVKSPYFCDYADLIAKREDISIEHVFVPIRDLNAAAESRRFVTRTGLKSLPLLRRLKHHIFKREGFAGGLWHIKSQTRRKQEDILAGKLYKLLLAISTMNTSMTLIRYPRLFLSIQQTRTGLAQYYLPDFL